MPHTRSDYDSPWKEIIEHYFPDFMRFFFPAIHAEIDWTPGYEFLDKELQRVVRRAKQGRGHVDKLVKVWKADGGEEWLLIHIEVQSQPETGFGERLFVYGYRLIDRYAKKVVSLAVLSDSDPAWRPSEYGYAQWGYEIGVKFPTVKLLDFAADWDELEQSKNPFAVVVMAHLRTQATQRNPQARLSWKKELVRNLYARAWPRADILELFRFIDWVMILPEPLELQFDVALNEIEKEEKMRYVTGIERRAIERGLEQGIERGLEQGSLRATRENVIEILSVRFPLLPQEIIDSIGHLDDLAQLKTLLRQAALAGTIEEFERMIES